MSTKEDVRESLRLERVETDRVIADLRAKLHAAEQLLERYRAAIEKHRRDVPAGDLLPTDYELYSVLSDPDEESSE